MPLQLLEPGETIGAQRGEVVVCIPVYGAHEQFVGCLESVLEHTPAEVPILVCDDASPDRRSAEHVHGLSRGEGSGRRLLYLRHEDNVGFPANANSALSSAAPADVVLLNSDCVVAAGWLEGLRDAALSDSAVATATALTNHGTIVSVPERWTPASALPDGLSLADAAGAVRSRSLRLHPRLPTAVGHCFYIRRSAIELVGDFDLAFSPGYGEEVDFSQRCLAHGLRHVAADEVLVLHHGGGSFAGDGVPNPVQAEHEEMLAQRYPRYHDAVRATIGDLAAPLVRSLGAARRALTGLAVTIDARGARDADSLDQARALGEALARTGQARVALLTSTAPAAPADRPDVVHRLFPFGDEAEFRSVRHLAERLVISQPDLIAYHHPSYFESSADWERHRSLTRAALAAADHVIFPTYAARADAFAEGLVAGDRASVVAPGVDELSRSAGGRREEPAGAERLHDGREAMLVMGGDRHHENRVFALRILEQLQHQHGWPGALVLAGPRVAHGSSAAEEAAILARSDTLRDAVIDLDEPGDAQRAWLLGRIALVLDPALGQGFGTVPFEAAAHDVPCLWPEGTWLSELLPDVGGGIVPWDAALSAQRARELLVDQRARTRNITAIRGLASRLTLEASAAGLVKVYDATCDAAAQRRSPLPPPQLPQPPQHPPLPLSEDALRLVGPGGALPAELERPLLALATHPHLGRPLLGALKAGYRGSHWLRRWMGPRS